MSPQSRAFQALWPKKLDVVECALCHEEVTEIPPHLAAEHRTITLPEYRAQFPSAPLRGEPVEQAPEERTDVVTITEAEANAHPGGREAAMVEAMLADEERVAFRMDVESLVSEGHQPGHLLASLCHLMTLARRCRARLESTRDKTDGEIFASEALETLHDLEDKITKGYQNIEKLRIQRLQQQGEDPLVVVEAELEAAEQWVQENIGEFQERCPGCGLMLTPPALPHWAYEPVKTSQHGITWPVWSRELWAMVLDRTIPLWMMAFVLRTSPEGLRHTARRREELWPDWIDLPEQETLLRERLNKQDREIKARLLPEETETAATTKEDDDVGG